MISNLPVYNRGTTQLIMASLSDETGAAIPTGALSALKCWLKVKATGEVLNSRNGQSILNTNGGTYADGAFSLLLSPSDNVHHGEASIEEHVLTIEWAYNGGSKKGVEEFLLRVRDVEAL